jgi:hypothetical protein
MMYISKLRFWMFIVLAFGLGCLTNCSCSVSSDNKGRRVVKEEVRMVIPADRAKEAAELYATVYRASMDHGRGGWSQEDAEKAVMAIYGQPSR